MSSVHAVGDVLTQGIVDVVVDRRYLNREGVWEEAQRVARYNAARIEGVHVEAVELAPKVTVETDPVAPFANRYRLTYTARRYGAA